VSRIEKTIIKLKSRPRTFKYSEVKRILEYLGYFEDTKGKTTGSRVQFIHKERKPIDLHKPHPGDEMKSYLIRLVAEQLEEEGLI
jgi:predicted RNA binding protein YcfA (HicA-like mRNA interferase family)